jgi:hypothetical protein
VVHRDRREQHPEPPDGRPSDHLNGAQKVQARPLFRTSAAQPGRSAGDDDQRHRHQERVGGFDTAFTDGAEDWDFWLSAAAAGARAEGIAEVLTYYHRGPGSRERAARARGTSRDLMAKLATKHRRLYETHLTDALALLYEEYAGTADALERVYEHPLLRLATAWRARRTGRP